MMYHYYVKIIPEKGPSTAWFSGSVVASDGIETSEDYQIIAESIKSHKEIAEAAERLGGTVAIINLSKL